MEFENKKLRDVADVAARIMMGEKALHPNQQKLDVHEPEKDKLTAKDFEMLRNKKKVKEETEEVAEEIEQIEEKEGYGSSDPLANRASYAKKHGTGQVYKKTYPGDKVGMTKSHAYDIKRAGPKGKLPEEVEHIEEGTPAKNTDVADKSYLKDMGKKPTVKSDLKNLGRFITGKKETKEDVDQAAEFVLEYESKDGKFVHRARPGAYGGTKDEKHAVDTLSGPKTKELKAIESEKKKKMSEMVATYKEQGLKGLFEALKKEEVIVEEPTSAEFDAQLADAKQRAAGTKKQPEVSKPAVQAVQNEETHTTVEFIDYNDVNGVKISEIDLEERSLTEPEMKKKEEIVKSMKKGISGFKERYGKDAKSVMYATATKQAKGE